MEQEAAGAPDPRGERWNAPLLREAPCRVLKPGLLRSAHAGLAPLGGRSQLQIQPELRARGVRV
eukprot:3768918-Alexandrium_andersonii.AAC.1